MQIGVLLDSSGASYAPPAATGSVDFQMYSCRLAAGVLATPVCSAGIIFGVGASYGNKREKQEPPHGNGTAPPSIKSCVICLRGSSAKTIAEAFGSAL
jgi:hypothetical protein